ncbi:MAG: hypothetical protein Q8896_02845 [Bacteroidota bacterium]|nr:hypothetical protein [Bacteroidota bacterium]
MAQRLALILLGALSICSTAFAQGLTGSQLTFVNNTFNRLLIVPPTGSFSNYLLTLPNAAPALGSLLYTNNGAGQLAWVTPGLNGQALVLSGGVPTWAPITSGTVTSVGLSMPAGFIVGSSPVISSGTIAVTTLLNGVIRGTGTGFTTGPVNVATEVTGVLNDSNGGTGLNTSATSGGSILYRNALGTAWTTLPAGSDGLVLSLASGIPAWSPSSSLFAGWALTGNSGTTAWNGSTGNFLGTTDAQPLVVATTNTSTPQPIEFLSGNIERARISPAGNVGIGTSAPNTMLDIRKDFAVRVDTLTITNGVQNDVAINSSSNLRAYYSGGGILRDTITGLTGGFDGKELRILNTVHGIMTLTNEDSRSSAANRIFTVDGKDLQVGDTGAINLFYDSKMSRWLVRSATRQIAGAAAAGLASFDLQFIDDSIGSQVNLTVDTSLVITDVQPYQVINIEGMLFVTSNVGNGNIRIALDVPNDFNYFKVGVLSFQQNSNVSAGNDLLTQDAIASVNTFNVDAGVTTIIHLSGVYVNGPSKGDIHLLYREASANGWIKINQGSYLVGHKLQ